MKHDLLLIAPSLNLLRLLVFVLAGADLTMLLVEEGVSVLPSRLPLAHSLILLLNAHDVID